METIKKILFKENRVYLETNIGNTYSRPLEAFPILKDATEKQREAFKNGER